MVNNKSNELKTYELVEGWLEEYRSTSDKSKKAKFRALIVTQMLPIIKKIARTIARRSYDPIEDMVQAGAIGLLKAIEKYSKNINDNFKIYAGYLIIGEMKHYLRDKLNTIKVPAHVQELVVRINNFTSTLTNEELDELTNEDVAEALNIKPKSVDFAMQANRRSSTVSLEAIFSTDNGGLNYEEVIRQDDYEASRDFEDFKIIVENAIQKLPEESQKLIFMYYNQDMSQKEIAVKLNYTQMQVSRKMKHAFGLLHKMIADKTPENSFD